MRVLPVKGRIEAIEDAVIVKVEVSRPGLSDVLAQLSCLRYGVIEQLKVEVSEQILELRLDDALSPPNRARIGSRDSELVLELSETELEAWLSFLASCYWHEHAPVDHVDTSVLDEAGMEYTIVLAVRTVVNYKTPEETRRALGLD